MLEDLRVLPLADSGQLEIHPRAFDLASDAQIAVRGFEARASAVKIRLNLQASEKLLFTGNPNRITQVIGNLINNALQHTPAGGEITVKLEPQTIMKLETQWLQSAQTGAG